MLSALRLGATLKLALLGVAAIEIVVLAKKVFESAPNAGRARREFLGCAIKLVNERGTKALAAESIEDVERAGEALKQVRLLRPKVDDGWDSDAEKAAFASLTRYVAVEVARIIREEAVQGAQTVASDVSASAQAVANDIKAEFAGIQAFLSERFQWNPDEKKPA